MNIARKARAIYLAKKDVAGFSAQLNGKIESLANECLDADDRLTVDSFTVNGQSFAGSAMPKWELLELLLQIQKMIADGGSYSTRVSRLSFY